MDPHVVVATKSFKNNLIFNINERTLPLIFMFGETMKSLLILLLLAASVTYGQEKRKTVTVLYADFKPMGFIQDGKPAGFDIDLWEAVADDAKILFKYKQVPFNQIIPALQNKQVDIGLAGISMTAEREEMVDFSHPYFESGLRLLTKVNAEATILDRLVTVVTDRNLVSAIIFFLLFLVGSSHILYFAERGSNKAINDNYFPGIFEAMWCVFAVMTTIGFGDIAPVKWIGRAATVPIAIVGMIFHGWFAGVVVTSMVRVEQTQYTRIADPTDLSGYRIATKVGTTSETTIQSNDGQLVRASSISEAYMKLAYDEVDGVLFDSPSILYRLKSDKSNQYAMVGGFINKQNYAIALQEKSHLRERINRSLLKLHGDGTYDRIYNKWFK